MNISKVTKITTSDIAESPKSLVILYDTGVQFSFFETDKDKLHYESEWTSIQKWVEDGNTIQEVT